MHKTASDLLTDLKDQESALISGDYTHFQGMSVDPHPKLESLDLDVDEWAAIQQQAQRNTNLLAAAMAGIAAAQDRIEHTLHAPMHVYTQDGQRRAVSSSRPNVVRRR